MPKIRPEQRLSRVQVENSFLHDLEQISRRFWLTPLNSPDMINRGVVQTLKRLDEITGYLSEYERKSLQFMWILNGGKKEDF